MLFLNFSTTDKISAFRSNSYEVSYFYILRPLKAALSAHVLQYLTQG